MCPAHRDLPTPPTLTLGSTFRIQYHHIPITASRLFHSQQPFRPFSSIGSAFRPHHRRIHITASRLFHSQQPFRPFSSIGSAFRPHHRRIHITASRLFHSRHPFRPFFSIGSAFRPHHRRIHITASNLFHSRHPFRPFSSIGSTFRSQHRRIQTQVNKTPTLHNQALLKKSPRGVQRGRGFAAPLRFTFSSKKYCASFAKKANATQYFKKSISNLLLLYLTTRTLYIPSISLSSSSALAEAALSRSIRV